MASSRTVTCVTSSLISLGKTRHAPRNLTPFSLRRTGAHAPPSSLLARPPVYAPLFLRYQSSAPASTLPEPPDYLSDGELAIFNKLKAELQPVRLEVQDVSGGCGSMYALSIESAKFNGLTVIKQHKLVNQVLAEDIKKWHGVQLRTKAI